MNLELVARRLKVPILDKRELEGEGYLIHLPDGTHEILVKDRRENPEDIRHPRTRFTIGHEFGHLYLHQAIRNPDSGHEVKEVSQRQVEQWCNTFGRNILIPRDALKKYYGSPSGISLDTIASGPEAFEATLPPFVYQTGAVFSRDVCHLESIDPLRIREFPSRLSGDLEQQRAVENALSSAVDRGQETERLVGPVTVRTEEITVDVIGLVTG